MNLHTYSLIGRVGPPPPDRRACGSASRGSQGDAAARYELGCRYWDGHEVNRDPRQALTLLSSPRARDTWAHAYFTLVSYSEDAKDGLGLRPLAWNDSNLG